MKNTLLFSLILLSFSAVSQKYPPNSNMVIIDAAKDSFYLIIDDVVQNVFPKKQQKK